MKAKVTRKSILSGYNKVLSVGYCELQRLFYFEKERFYTCGVYGWNANVFTFKDTAIVTGYRPFGKDVDHELIKAYEEKADAIIKNTSLHPDQQKQMIRVLIDEFIQKA